MSFTHDDNGFAVRQLRSCREVFPKDFLPFEAEHDDLEKPARDSSDVPFAAACFADHFRLAVVRLARGRILASR